MATAPFFSVRRNVFIKTEPKSLQAVHMAVPPPAPISRVFCTHPHHVFICPPGSCSDFKWGLTVFQCLLIWTSRRRESEATMPPAARHRCDRTGLRASQGFRPHMFKHGLPGGQKANALCFQLSSIIVYLRTLVFYQKRWQTTTFSLSLKQGAIIM